MTKGRLEAFSDAVIAIIMTIMVLELRAPHGDAIRDLKPLVPIIVSYVLSFVHIAIYWNNHHHLLQRAHQVTGAVLWANMHLLFWLSLIPFATAWMGENSFTCGPVTAYGFVLCACGVAYYILVQCLIRGDGRESHVAQAVGKDIKGKISVVVYLAGMAVAQVFPIGGGILYAAVALMWLVPDRRLERAVGSVNQPADHSDH